MPLNLLLISVLITEGLSGNKAGFFCMLQPFQKSGTKHIQNKSEEHLTQMISVFPPLTSKDKMCDKML